MNYLLTPIIAQLSMKPKPLVIRIDETVAATRECSRSKRASLASAAALVATGLPTGSAVPPPSPIHRHQ